MKLGGQEWFWYGIGAAEEVGEHEKIERQNPLLARWWWWLLAPGELWWRTKREEEVVVLKGLLPGGRWYIVPSNRVRDTALTSTIGTNKGRGHLACFHRDLGLPGVQCLIIYSMSLILFE